MSSIARAPDPGLTVVIYYDDTEVYSRWQVGDSNCWNDENYRTIVLDSPAEGKVLEFLEKFATKIS